MTDKTHDFLTEIGFEVFSEPHVNHSKNLYQKRLDIESPKLPICKLNDKLFLNVYEYDTNISEEKFHKAQFELGGDISDEAEYRWYLITTTVDWDRVPDVYEGVLSRLIAGWQAVNDPSICA